MNRTATARVLCVVGARPNFVKIAPVLAALRSAPSPVPAVLVHTGQHYDEAMTGTFFRELDIPPPDVNLGVGSKSHAAQTAEVMLRLEPLLERLAPELLLVVGDVNSTLAAALVAAKRGLAVAHVEAGLRSYDRSMPEEINRVLTDQLAELLFTTERAARNNLLREGVDAGRIHFVGNVMIDTLRRRLPFAVPPERLALDHGLDPAVWCAGPGGYGVVTLHRPSNVEEPAGLLRLVETLRRIARDVRLFFPVHPRTKVRLERCGAALGDRIAPLPPLGYLEMLGLVARAALVLTDSGGLQEETTALGVPCLTLRPHTERPVTVREGTNLVVGNDPERILAAVEEILATGGKRGRVPELWDGRAAERIKSVILSWLATRTSAVPDPAGREHDIAIGRGGPQ